MNLHELIGDATSPCTAPPWVIAHVCNDIGKGGRGFVLAPLRLEALGDCRARLSDFAAERGASVHMPRIGTGLAGGD